MIVLIDYERLGYIIHLHLYTHTYDYMYNITCTYITYVFRAMTSSCVHGILYCIHVMGLINNY